MSDPIFSPDGKWMWTGNEWIPSPPGSNNTSVSLKDSVVSGDINITQNHDPKSIGQGFKIALKEIADEKAAEEAAKAAEEAAKTPAEIQEYFDLIGLMNIPYFKAVLVYVDGTISDVIGTSKLIDEIYDGDGAVVMVYNGPIDENILFLAVQSAKIHTVVGTEEGEGFSNETWWNRDRSAWLTEKHACAITHASIYSARLCVE